MDVLMKDRPICATKQAIASAFGRAAASYDNHAAFQREVGHQLLALMPDRLVGKRVLDLGCGTGYFSQFLCEAGCDLVCADLSEEMLDQAKQKCGAANAEFMQCDAELLPFADSSFDYVFSSLALQWCDDLAVPLKEIKRILKPGGQGYFSTLLEGSLYELDQAWSKVDSYQHVNRFISHNQVKLALAQADYLKHHLFLQPITLRYASAFALMKDLKGIGATHVEGRAKGLVSRQTLAQVEAAYRACCGLEEDLPATYQVCFGVLHR
jgi:malonyl-CoA O-methyltransferase